MTGERRSTPKILVPFQKAPDGVDCQEIVVYLRPETNGVQTESILFRVFRGAEWNSQVKLVYLANLPGGFLRQRQVVEKHYSLRLDFARKGVALFTVAMRATFRDFFRVPFEAAEVIGAYEALERLNLSSEELFQLWVPAEDILELEGQLIKKVAGNLFVVNYDIPAVLEKNHVGTDYAAMVFRTPLSYQAFRPAVEAIRKALVSEGLLAAERAERRVFHWSKGPFEQLLDASGHVYNVRDEPVSWDELSFGRYLLAKGWTTTEIEDCLERPFQFGVNLLSNTNFATFEEAWSFVQERSPR